MIDKTTGQFKFSKDFVVSKQSTPDELIHYFGMENVEAKGMGLGWGQYTVRNIQIDHTYFIITFYFNNHTLEIFNFIVSDKFIETGSWDDWSEKRELEKLDYYNNWLTSQIGEKDNFLGDRSAHFLTVKVDLQILF